MLKAFPLPADAFVDTDGHPSDLRGRKAAA
jgi:hypothetical protein